MADSSAISRFRDNLQGEVDSAGLYRVLSESEPDPHLAEVYRRLAAVEEAHAEYWRTQLQRAGAKAGLLQAGWRARGLGWLARRFGPQFVLPTISALEQRDSSQYDNQPEAVAGGLPDAERSHNRIVQRIAATIPGGLSGGTLARIEGRHRMGGNTLRAAVLGANDGLVSNLSLVMGAAGALAPTAPLLVGGPAGLVAGALPFAIGGWVSATRSRELEPRPIAAEAAEPP